MRLLDLFSGIGGFSLGLERAGFKTVAFCEIDPFCQRVLAKHWPEVPCYDDVRTLSADRLEDDGIGPIDAICGGFPCQDLSRAGSKVGIAGARSGLWDDFARLVGELQPRFCIVENVAGLLDAGMGVVLGDLASMGYDADWGCVPASAVGLPHQRERIWIVAYPAVLGQPEPGHLWQDACRHAARPSWQATDAVDALRRGAVPALCREHDGLSRRLDQSRLTALGNAVVPQIPEIIGRAIVAADRAMTLEAAA